MAKPSTKWATTYSCSSMRKVRSQREAYDQVIADAADGIRQTTVWIDEGMGFGWQKYEVIDH
jgi:hypothetical protein